MILVYFSNFPSNIDWGYLGEAVFKRSNHLYLRAALRNNSVYFLHKNVVYHGLHYIGLLVIHVIYKYKNR